MKFKDISQKNIYECVGGGWDDKAKTNFQKIKNEKTFFGKCSKSDDQAYSYGIIINRYLPLTKQNKTKQNKTKKFVLTNSRNLIILNAHS